MPTIAEELRAKAAAMQAAAKTLLAAAAVLESSEQAAPVAAPAVGVGSAPAPSPTSARQVYTADGAAITAAIKAIKSQVSLPSVVQELTARGYEVTPDTRARASTILNRMEKREELVKVVQGSGSTPNIYAKKEAEKG